MKKYSVPIIIVAVLLLLGALMPTSHSYVEYAAYNGSNCMACHTGPMGGFGRYPTSTNDIGFITENFYMSGDFRFMALSDQREGSDDRVVFFPMEGALHFGFDLNENISLAASNDFGQLRELFGMIHNKNKTAYARAGFFTLPYGLLVQDHTAFIKEGRVKTGTRTFEEVGLGAGLFSVRYKDAGVEAGLSGRPWFLNLALTSGVVGQEERTFPSSQGGSKKAVTRRAGFILNNVSLGVSQYNNDNELLDRRISRWGVFGWLKGGPLALIFEHDEGEEEQFTVNGSTQINASYAELVYNFPITQEKWPSYAKARYERLDPNRSIDSNELERWVFSYRVSPHDNVSIEGFYRNNKEKPRDLSNDDVFVITHLSF